MIEIWERMECCNLHNSHIQMGIASCGVGGWYQFLFNALSGDGNEVIGCSGYFPLEFQWNLKENYGLREN